MSTRKPSITSKDEVASNRNDNQEETSQTSIKTLKAEISEFIKREDSSPDNSNQFYPGMERTNYDFASERHNPYATNLLEATSYLVKGCLGAGILSMHEAFMFGGMLASCLGAVAVAFLLSTSMTMVITSAQKMYVALRVSRLSYPDLAEAAVATGPFKKMRKYKKHFRYMIESFLFLQMSGTCSIYQIMIAKTVKKVSEFLWSSVYTLELTLRSYILIVMLPLLIICLIRQWNYVAQFSIVADLFLGICIITTMLYSIPEIEHISNRPLWKTVPGMFRFFGMCLYSMDALHLVLPIENNMKSPHHIVFVIHCAMNIVFVTVALTGFIGYWGWGENCKSPLTIHMPLEIIPIILQCAIAAVLTLTFPIQFWVPFKIVWRYVEKAHHEGPRKGYIRERIFRVIYLLCITGLSTLFLRLDNLMVFIGDFFVSINSFIFPSIIETLVIWNSYRPGFTRWAVVKDAFIATLGVIFCIGGLYSLNHQ